MTVLDAGVLIAVLDPDDPHHKAATAALRPLVDTGESLVLPASAYAEILVGPYAHGLEAVGHVDSFIDALPASVLPINRAIAAHAAELRARHRSLRLPDALVISTAIVSGADRLMTTDSRWPTVGVAVEVLEP